MSIGGIKVGELQFAKNFICNYLNDGTTEGIAEAMEIRMGDNELLLKHLNVLIDIFTKAEEELERWQNDAES